MPPATEQPHLHVEAARLSALKNLGILDTPREALFDRMADLAAAIFQTPTALLSLVDKDRQWFKARHGWTAEQTSRETSFCSHAILGDKVMVVPDARDDVRFADNPLVTSGPRIRFYAGAPLCVAGRHKVGTMCVIDTVPHHDFAEDEQHILEELAALAAERMEARAIAENREMALTAEKRMKDQLAKTVLHRETLLRELHHRVRNNLQTISSIIQLKSASAPPGSPLRLELESVAGRIDVLSDIHKQLYTAQNFGNVDLGLQLSRLTHDLVELHGSSVRTEIAIVGGPILVDPDTAMPLGLLVNEIVVNSLKHASYPAGVTGRLSLRLERTAQVLRLEIRDTGYDPPDIKSLKTGIGTLLIQSIAEQLGATVTTRADGGWWVTVEIPARQVSCH